MRVHYRLEAGVVEGEVDHKEVIDIAIQIQVLVLIEVRIQWDGMEKL